MGLFILTETSAGYALLKAKDKKLLETGSISAESAVEDVVSLLKLKNFQKFDSAATALEEVASLVEGKVTPRLASLLDSIKDEKKASLAVADPKLANAINKLPQLSIVPVADSKTQDLYRAIRNHLPSLIPGLLPSDISTMSLGLSHSLSRHKLKFSPDKIDTMIVQAIALLDDLDKELNMYAMRVKEWYGWHFPELGKILNDNLAYARVVLTMGMRTAAAGADLATILPEEIETAVKAAAEVSMGTEITTDDLTHIQMLAQQVVDFTEYRAQLASYLSARMKAIAPNLTALVGDLVGARLIAHAGSLMNLAKNPASTIQILGAEKALFRALKTKHDTPKYGLIYHASLIGQATGKNKGKIARVLAAKAAIGLRVDALADWAVEEGAEEPLEEEKAALGTESRLKIERRLASLEGRPLRAKGVAIGPGGTSAQPGKWEVNEARKYNRDADGLIGNEDAAIKSKGKKLVEEITPAAESADDNEDDGDDDDSDDDAPAGTANGQPDADGDTTMGNASTRTSKSTTSSRPVANGISKSTSQSDRVQGSATASEGSKKARKQDRHHEHGSVQTTAQQSGPPTVNIAALAAQTGLSEARCERKLARGEIRFDADGRPTVISKKDVKAAAKAANGESSHKRKREREDGEKAERKKKKKERSSR